jgi:hypothetical protein
MIIELLLSLFPGMFIILIFFKKEPILSKVILFFLTNIMILTMVSVLLGFNELSFKLIGGLTRNNLLIAYSFINILLICAFFINKKN